MIALARDIADSVSIELSPNRGQILESLLYVGLFLYYFNSNYNSDLKSCPATASSEQFWHGNSRGELAPVACEDLKSRVFSVVIQVRQ